jgi:hypothetical protein
MECPLCSYGRIESREHLILYYRWYKKKGKKFKKVLNVPMLSLRHLFCTKKGIEAAMDYINQTKIINKGVVYWLFSRG